MAVETKTKSPGNRALWYEGPRQVALREEPAATPAAGELGVTTLWTALSRGTERLVYEGRVPQSEWARMRCPAQAGDFPFPVKYGYCAVGRVETGPAELQGRLAFALQPHQTRFVARPDMLALLPEGLSPRRATLGANMETALNGLWDSGAGPGDRIVIVGGGVVGLLVAYLAAGVPGADVTLVDVDASRASIAQSFGARFATPEDARNLPEADIVFHTSASEAGLVTALALGGLEATIVEMSWYGDRAITLPLGADFHSRRYRLLSSQVGQVSPGRRPRWTYARRIAKALELLCDDRLDALFTHEIAFADLPAQLGALLDPRTPALAVAIRY